MGDSSSEHPGGSSAPVSGLHGAVSASEAGASSVPQRLASLPKAEVRTVRLRCFVPWQVHEQALHSAHSFSTQSMSAVHFWVLHNLYSSIGPETALPQSLACLSTLRSLTCRPPSQDTVHSLHWLQGLHLASMHEPQG